VLRYAAGLVTGAVDQQTLYDLDDTKFFPWLKIVMGEPLPKGLKLRTIRNRMRKWLVV